MQACISDAQRECERVGREKKEFEGTNKYRYENSPRPSISFSLSFSSSVSVSRPHAWKHTHTHTHTYTHTHTHTHTHTKTSYLSLSVPHQDGLCRVAPLRLRRALLRAQQHHVEALAALNLARLSHLLKGLVVSAGERSREGESERERERETVKERER